MKDFLKTSAAITLALLLVLVAVTFMPQPLAHAGQAVGEQALLKMRFLNDGVQALGAGVLQTSEINTLSAPIATGTLTETVAAPSAGSVVVAGVLVEKSTGAAGTWTLKYGTGVNCATGTTTILGPVTNPSIGFTRLDIVVPATNALCAQTDAATTLVRTLTK
jgi:Na+/H+ antiporter NhaB